MRLPCALFGFVLVVGGALDPTVLELAPSASPWPAIVGGGIMLLAAALWREGDE